MNRWILFCCLALATFQVVSMPRPASAQESEGEEEESTPAIFEPEPDTADLPDSAFVVPPGTVYFETSITYERTKKIREREFFTATLIRAGLGHDLEFRLSTPGVVARQNPTDTDTGFGPLTFGVKRHFWDGEKETFKPAFGMIFQVTAPTASQGFDSGTAEPAMFFNFDYELANDFAFEWNGGLASIEADDGNRVMQGIILYSISKNWTDRFQNFIQGAVLTPSGSGDQEEVLLGPGFLWAIGDRVALDGSYTFGLTDEAAHRLIRLGMSMRF